ncbi:MAG: SDR family oxidoreductase, partial [Actinomycetota bacterium]|nr:SDR family oxidoreductase [Actinomycetota bacterium]
VVTGAAGFLGSHLCDRLMDAGAEVVGIDNLLTGRAKNLEHLVGREGFRFVKYDVTDYVHVPGSVDFVLHFASPASPVDYLQLPIQTLKVGALGTHKALGLARAKSARFMLASTSEVYGDPQVHPQPETYWGHVNPIGPRGVYDEAKRFAEAMTYAYHRTHGVDVRVARIFNTFGPRLRRDDGRAVPTFIAQALRAEPLTVHGDGAQTRSLCYVDDMVDGLLRLLGSDYRDPVNVGNPREVTVLELAEAVQEAVGQRPGVRFVPRPQDDPQVRRPDTTIAERELGWKATVPLREGLRQTVAWYRAS